MCVILCVDIHHVCDTMNGMFVCRFIPRIPCYESCYSTDVTSVQTVIQVERNQATGQLLGFYEARP